MTLALALGAAAAIGAAQGGMPAECEPAAFEAHYGRWGVDTSGQDRNIRPGDDFAMHAWGKWHREAEIPPGMPAAWNRMDMMRRNQGRLRCAIEASARDPSTPNRRLIADLYHSYMDEAAIERVGDAPLLRDLEGLRALSDRSAIAERMGREAGGLGLGFFKISIAPRLDDPSRYIVRLRQSGLGAGPREFYAAGGNEAGQKAYRDHVAAMLKLVGWPDPEGEAGKILALEKRIAGVSWSQTQSDDLAATFNLTPRAELGQVAPGFDWEAYLKGAGLGAATSLVVMEKSAFPRIAEIFAQTPVATLKAWMAFHEADRAAPYMPAAYRKAHFDYWGRRQDLESPRPRADGAVELVSRMLVHPVSREYMRLYFSPATKQAVEAMVTNIKAGMRARLSKADWMSPPTKREALAKLEAVHVGIGHPDRWRDFSGLELRADDLYGNIQKASAYEWAWQAGKLGRPVDRDEWLLEPFTLGAMAIYTRSFLTFSTGFLQPPYFDPSADPAVNYGAIGATIGHEIGHLFDAGGAKVDSTGRMRNWWAPADEAKFKRKVDRFVARLNGYKEEDGQPVNGTAALSEQMAHLTGLEAALDGYHISLNGEQAPVIDGYSGDQRFFLAYAQIWQGKARDWFRKEQYEHPPLVVIVNDVVRSMDDWYAAFDVRPGDALYLKPEDRIAIW